MGNLLTWDYYPFLILRNYRTTTLINQYQPIDFNKDYYVSLAYWQSIVVDISLSLPSGANFQVGNVKASMLICAVWANNYQLVQYLLKHSVKDRNIPLPITDTKASFNSISAKSEARRLGYRDILKLLNNT